MTKRDLVPKTGNPITPVRRYFQRGEKHHQSIFRYLPGRLMMIGKILIDPRFYLQINLALAAEEKRRLMEKRQRAGSNLPASQSGQSPASHTPQIDD